MLKIIVNNQEVDLGELKGITLQYKNTFFDIKNITGSYTVPFNIPMSDRNREIFDFPLRPEKAVNEIKEFDCEIWHSGILIEEGTIKADMFKDNSIQCSIYIYNGDLFSKFKKEKLSERNYGEDIVFEFKTAYDPIADDYLMFEVENEDFLKDTIWEETEISKYADEGYYDFDYVEYNIAGLSFQSVTHYRNITGWDKKVYPCLYFRVNNAGDTLYAYLTETDMLNDTNPVFYAAAYTDTVTEINNSGFGGTLVVGYIEPDDKFVAEYIGATKRQNVFKREFYSDVVGAPYFHNKKPVIITPFPLLHKTIKRLFNNIGYIYVDNFLTQPDFNAITIYNNNNIVKGEYYDGNRVYNSLQPFSLASILPDIKTEEFIIAVQNFFNIFFNKRPGKIEVIERYTVIKSSEYEDYNNIITKIHSKKIFEDVSGYILKIRKDPEDLLTSNLENYGEYDSVLYTVEADSNWEANLEIGDIVHDGINGQIFNTSYSIDAFLGLVLEQKLNPLISYDHFFQSFSTNNKEFEIDLGLSTLSYYDANYNNNECLRTKQKGNSYIDSKKDKNNCTLRLMAYDGLQQYNNNTYKKPLGAQQSGVVEISPNWAYTNRWKPYIEWYKEASKTEYECSMILTASQIKNIDFMKKKLYNNSLYFIKSMRVKLLRNSISPVEATLLKA